MPLLIQRHTTTATESRSGVSRGVSTFNAPSAGAYQPSNTTSSTLLAGTGTTCR